MRQPLSVRLLSPIGVLCASIAFWWICYLAPFNAYTLPQSNEAYLLLFGYLAAFVGGTLVWRQRGRIVPAVREDPVRAHRIAFTVLLAVAALGLALRFYNLLAVKDYGSYASAAEFRMAEVEDGPQAPGAISALSVVLYPISFVTFLVSLHLHRRLKLWQKATAVALLFGFGGYFVLQGGRTLIVTAGIMTVCTIIMRGWVDPSKAIDRRKLAVFAIGLMLAFGAFVGYSSHVLQSRLESMGVTDPHAFLDIVEEDRGYKIQEPYRTMLNTSSPTVTQSILTLSSLTYYVNHGFFDFSELYESEQGQRPLGGVMQFSALVRFLNSVGVDTPSVDEGIARIPRPGLFYTFFGNVLLDFGTLGGLLYCFALGAVIQAVWLRARTGSLLCLLLYPFFVSVMFHFPMLDMIAGGYGLFVVFGVLFSVGLLKFCGAAFKARRQRGMALQPA